MGEEQLVDFFRAHIFKRRRNLRYGRTESRVDQEILSVRFHKNGVRTARVDKEDPHVVFAGNGDGFVILPYFTVGTVRIRYRFGRPRGCRFFRNAFRTSGKPDKGSQHRKGCKNTRKNLFNH